MRPMSFQAGALTAVKRHSMATTKASKVTTYRRKTDKVQASMDMAAEELGTFRVTKRKKKRKKRRGTRVYIHIRFPWNLYYSLEKVVNGQM